MHIDADPRFAPLEDRLADLASAWRGLASKDKQAEQQIVEEYHKVVKQMRDLGWDGKGLSADAHLPDRLMPPLW